VTSHWTHQPVTYDLRLPDEAQADALRLLDASREVVNETLVLLWPSLDAFASQQCGPAWKQVGQHTGSPQPHGDRQWRCESETAGRILRAQAQRKKVYALIAPVLHSPQNGDTARRKKARGDQRSCFGLAKQSG